MASSKDGQVTLRGRFRPGTVVSLVRVAGEHTLRSEGGEEVDRKRVDDEGSVQFTGLEVDARYFAVGTLDGAPLEVRLRAREAKHDAGLLVQPPVGNDRTRLGLAGAGGWTDEYVGPHEPVVSESEPVVEDEVAAKRGSRSRAKSTTKKEQ